MRFRPPVVILVLAAGATSGIGAACDGDEAVPAAVDAGASPAEAGGGGVPDARPADVVVAPIPDADTGPPAIVSKVVPCSAIDTGFGVPVTLKSATATFSQSADYGIARAVDGFLDASYGWAIEPNDASAVTAAFETKDDTAAFAGGSRLVFVLKHTFPYEHVIGRFRLSVTTAARSAFADGNEGIATPGDVGSAGLWTVIMPRLLCASNDAVLKVFADGSILAQDTNATLVDYVIEAETNLTSITGLRLETFPDPTLPFGGPGTADGNGNFVLTELEMRVGVR